MTPFKPLDVTDDGFAFDPCTGESYTLNSCGQLVLQRLQQGENPKQIAHFLASHFGIAQSTAERDITDFFQQLNLFGLVGVKA